MNVVSFVALLFLSVHGAASADSLAFKEQCLKWHNHFRSKHQASAVQWSEDLEREAQSWADHLAGYDKFEHSGNFGENLCMFQGGDIKEPCTRATQSFYDEVKLYDFSKPGFSQTTGHFTQVVWKATSHIGAARADGKDGRLIVVVRYNPTGNINSAGAFRRNVLPEKAYQEEKKTNSARKSWPAVAMVTLVVAAVAVNVC